MDNLGKRFSKVRWWLSVTIWLWSIPNRYTSETWILWYLFEYGLELINSHISAACSLWWAWYTEEYFDILVWWCSFSPIVPCVKVKTTSTWTIIVIKLNKNSIKASTIDDWSQNSIWERTLLKVCRKRTFDFFNTSLFFSVRLANYYYTI